MMKGWGADATKLQQVKFGPSSYWYFVQLPNV